MKNKLNWEILSCKDRNKAIGEIKKLYSDFNKEAKISKFDYNIIDQDSIKDWWIFLNVNFSRGTGDLKITFPEVPG